jgi:hypothetical protein
MFALAKEENADAYSEALSIATLHGFLELGRYIP